MPPGTARAKTANRQSGSAREAVLRDIMPEPAFLVFSPTMIDGGGCGSFHFY